MILYILRHGIADDYHPEGDSRRALTGEGIKKAKEVLSFLKNKITPNLILTSPFVRAKQTAELAAGALGVKKVELSESLYPDTDLEDTLIEINARTDGELMLVGHDPHLSDLLSWLTCGKRNVFSLKKCGAAAVEFQGKAEAGRGNLKWLLTPGILGL